MGKIVYNSLKSRMTMPTPSKSKPALRVKPHSYQPSKAELEEDVSVNATPEEVAKAMAPRRIAQEPQGKR